jgi:hypothetical protein
MLCVSSLSSSAKPLKVFILAGLSNMEGHAEISTFDYIGKDPKTRADSTKINAYAHGCPPEILENQAPSIMLAKCLTGVFHL